MSYFQERMDLLGVTPEKNKVMLDENEHPDSFVNKKQRLYEADIFTENKDGDIEILLYTLRRKPFTYPEKGVHAAGPRTRYDVITRHSPENEPKKGRKYTISGRTGTHPWWHPFFLDAYEQETIIPVLTITEGAFKAWKATDCGIPTIGLSSITHYKDKTTDSLHPEIIELIKACKVEKIVILWDGDCLNVSEKALLDGEDLYKRPGGFFSAVRTICDLLKEYIDLKTTSVWFAHVNSRELHEAPKGIDDLFISEKDRTEVVVKDFMQMFDRVPAYFKRKNITSSFQELKKYFRITNAQEFYNAHSELIKDRPFVFLGSGWQYDGTELKMVRPATADKYFRVGDQYYHKYEAPNKFGIPEKVFSRISKETISDDHNKPFLKHIDKYNAFCVVPDHVNYQPVINNCYNAYAPFHHKPEEGECETTLDFIKHIFQEQYEMGLDYVQLLYQQPQRKLPILCLVSKENKTGKSTFAFWLQELFKGNVAIIGNQELADNFNAGWATKLVVACDESLIEKKATIEKIKALSTANKIFMNAKGRDHLEIDFFAKFILITNNEENFIYATEQDTRYWVRKVPVVDKERPILNQMVSEIPAFLQFMSTRKMHTEENGSRMFFTPQQITTDALKRVIIWNTPTVVKEMTSRLEDLFMDFGVSEIKMSLKTIARELMGKPVEENYIKRLLKENLKVDVYRNPEGKPVTHRFQWPKYITSYENGRPKQELGWIVENGRPYVFKREDFVDKGVEVERDASLLPPDAKQPGEELPFSI